MNRFALAWMRRSVAVGAVALACGVVRGQTPVALDEDSPWPRVRSTNGHTVTLHLPQVESWTSNSFTARAAVAVKAAGVKQEWLGVVWISAQGNVDRANRMVMLDRLEITRGRFPNAPNDASNALAIAREALPGGARTVSLDYLITALGFAQAAARQGPRGFKHEPPEIIWATNRAVLIIIDGAPALRPVAGTGLQRVVNTPALIVRQGDRFYLAGDGIWFVSGSLDGPWSLAQALPEEVSALTPAGGAVPAARSDEPRPRILVRTRPAELLVTSGLPDFRPIRGTGLQYAADTDSLLFFHPASREAYLLLSGRWFKAKSLEGPWTRVPGNELPPDFAKIPPGTAQAVALAAVPGTSQAELSVLANAAPITATVNRREARLEFAYAGEPQFKPIDGTQMSYAINAPLAVIRAGTNYYASEDGVWFLADLPQGPWQVAAEVPEEIYTIPPSSPVYFATFARVYQSTDTEVEVGYTPGYSGAYEEDGTVVYGTGWDYEPWYDDDDYYGWGWSWGYSYWYVPWYQGWVWRDWWSPPGGLRSALIENIYERWQDRNGVSPHDRLNNSKTRPGASAFFGYPAVYGRFRSGPRPASLAPPANTMALNPYARPASAARPGEMPRGAQLLANVRHSPGGGRDLYASPDGSVYRRKEDGWYRRDAGGQWKLAAATAGTVDRNAGTDARAPGIAGVGNSSRPVIGGNVRPGRVPDSGLEARAQEVAALEREYYARSLAQLRAENWRASNYRSRPARGAVRRR